MANSDRDGRLLDASVFNDAIASLSKVKEEQRMSFVHDQMMSAIDDICKKRQGTGKERFSAAQILILKDIIFHVLFVLDTRNRPAEGFLRSLWCDFLAQTPIKRVTIVFAFVTALAGTTYSAFSATKTWIFPGNSDTADNSAKSETKPNTKWQNAPAGRVDQRLDPYTAQAIQRLMDDLYKAQQLKAQQLK